MSKIQVPYRDNINSGGTLTKSWQFFFQRLFNQILAYIEPEQSIEIVNNQAVATDFVGLSFNKEFTSQATIEYLIQRTTDTTDLVQSGVLLAIYKYNTNSWVLHSLGAGPDVSGVAFSITAQGQVRYTSTNVTGTPRLSRIVYRLRQIEAKSSLYSRVGNYT